MINTVLFDVDGTLLDTEMANLGALQQMLLKHYHINKSIAELEFALGIPAHKIMAELQIPFAESVELWDAQMPEFQHLVKVFDGINHTIDNLLRERLALGVVTSENQTELERLVYPYGIVQKFPYVVTASDTTEHKPSPAPVLKALEATGAFAENTIYIGDSIYDLQSAKAAGVKFGLAGWGAHDRGQFESADYKFSSPAEIEAII
ncbi:pyrophosphatase ppaX [Amylolactobacillus amylotrophicus DSM 20534]|uniref:Pyrophosphatase ppaX n=3 Tax=Amylolactobacillus TaxID=2767876 RepID=A0A0R1YML2_9LACO|nr:MULTISPECIES: HAD family hydrolase [Amylolactobacillus]APT18820.1 hypothetical protein LA20533_05905 [Amylolactobacillus amylophilus DSM 20533 = JCM 1125]KRK37140.1 pyrophosphatase ppaX [Amylolactobacillus amylotrophicus DSM 20534]KRM43457.1 pyrophosphatase ppaX [Amylolactobacillus amylophilus DSM 20533 = JCM 1125]GED80828.1 phosphatase [Amylolactobacillus amylophilus]